VKPAALPPLVLRRLGLRPYEDTLEAMRAFSMARREDTADELWLLEHPACFTRGVRSRENPTAGGAHVPVVDTDRGGLITYHGPGQAVVYTLVDLQRLGWGVGRLVHALEQSVIDLLAAHGVPGQRRPGAPGVYVAGAKIAQLGLRVRRGRAYHGVSLNADLDLEPFSWIDPCGYPGLAVTRLCDLGIPLDAAGTAEALAGRLRVALTTDA
jgi:lipoyl(octanoyl) transferase